MYEVGDISDIVNPEDAGLALVSILVHRLGSVEEGGLVPHHQQSVALQLLHQLAGYVRPVPEGLHIEPQVPEREEQ